MDEFTEFSFFFNLKIVSALHLLAKQLHVSLFIFFFLI